MFEALVLVLDSAGVRVREATVTGDSLEAALQQVEQWVGANLRETTLDWDHVDVRVRRRA